MERRIDRGRGQTALAWLTPWRVAKLCALAVGASLLAVGLLGLTATGPAGAVPTGDLAAAADGFVHAVGTVDRSWVDGGDFVTHVRLVGAGAVDIQVAGEHPGQFAPGHFLELTGTKSGAVIAAQSVRHAVDPVDLAAPWVAAGAVLLVALGAVPLAVGLARLDPHGPGGPLLRRLLLPMRRDRPDREPTGPPARRHRPADNGSGRAEPKG